MKKIIEKVKKSFHSKQHSKMDPLSRQELDAKIEKGTQKAISQYRTTFEILTDFDKE